MILFLHSLNSGAALVLNGKAQNSVVAGEEDLTPCFESKMSNGTSQQSDLWM
jgi:hypothetical protein